MPQIIPKMRYLFLNDINNLMERFLFLSKKKFGK